MSTAHHFPHRRSDTTVLQPVRSAAAIVAGLFAVVGVLGFVPGVTRGLSEITFAGHDSGALLLGAFAVSVLHNLVHLAFGAAGMAMARTSKGAREFLLLGGTIYLALWAYGMVVPHDSHANFVPLNTADNWLHLGLAAAMIATALLFGTHVERTPITPPTPE
ncbi:DUF4383 domain-containing protein [Actinokineospora globicatena]|uniref:DUF4383 domain-containing protein n=1 Tax=Actinokineospora globicatena TaxID=103729 RepID=UPI0020A55E3B|nr:DUF4383 domain-containing protein [Actinokineospora globicatena]MCP2304561.1 protein of unknown function (DUF4383) [Actinokineospora globicatena]GLW78070.1 hypothetical protein Aglo01_25520 [Actinokineospora globicatena]GLW85264.1 hypothetical protein Aglo02_29040 [Actinokineospora globicatena]